MIPGVDSIYSREEIAERPYLAEALEHALRQQPPRGDGEDEHARRLAVRAYVEAIVAGDGWRSAREAAGGARNSVDETARLSGPWARAVTAVHLLAEQDAEVEWIVPALAAPGSITGIASPRGLGKTHIIHAAAVAVATGGTFCDAAVRRGRVLLIDRDNSRRELRRRLRGWCGGNPPTTLEVLTRDDAPALTDARAWASFPFAAYQLVILDSFGAATEGVSEKDGGESGEALAPLLDLARRGPAVIVLMNVPKDGRNYRGSGVVADRLDVLYEVRDATDLAPAAKDEMWWSQLPEAGEAAWAERAKRRGRRDDYRLVLVPSKFRIGEEPDPIALEVDLTPGAWTVRDVTRDLEAAHVAAKGEVAASIAAAAAAARTRLAELVATRHAGGTPVKTREAEEALRAEFPALRRGQIRDLIAAGGDWRREPIPGRGNPVVLVPSSAAQIANPGGSCIARVSDGLFPAGIAPQDPRKSPARNTTSGTDFASGTICATDADDMEEVITP